MTQPQHPFDRIADTLDGLRQSVDAGLAWIGSHAKLATLKDLKAMEKRLLMNAQQLTVLLDNATTQIGKISKEQSDRFDVVDAANKALQAAIDAGDVSPAIEDAAAKMQTALDNLDAAIPDAVPGTPA